MTTSRFSPASGVVSRDDVHVICYTPAGERQLERAAPMPGFSAAARGGALVTSDHGAGDDGAVGTPLFDGLLDEWALRKRPGIGAGS